ncbi:MAG: hypothetical protein H0T17_08325 [Propionibacteriales bacterium]|nr:hypothetical protein [Propionibacteriales bacterium]
MSEVDEAVTLNESRASYAADLDPEDLAFHRRYGPWDAWTPDQAKPVFDGIGLTWWIAGGWSIEAFTGTARKHEDIDVSMWRRDVPALVQALAGRYDVWAAGGSLTPLYDDKLEMPETADQVWIRRHALAPWRADCVVNRDRDGRWVSRRDSDLEAPLEEVTWERDGIRYLNPEITLSFKAKLHRPKDNQDLAAALPLLNDDARAYLADFLARHEPDHPWRSQV